LLDPGEIKTGVFETIGDNVSAKIHLTAEQGAFDWRIADEGGTPLREFFNETSVDYPFVPQAGRWSLQLVNSSSASITVKTRIELYGKDTLTFRWQ